MILPDLVVVGPTAAGKTDLTVELAIRMDGEGGIRRRAADSSADAHRYRQTRRGADARRAPPHDRLRGCGRALLGLAASQQDARACMEQIHARGQDRDPLRGTGYTSTRCCMSWTLAARPTWIFEGNCRLCGSGGQSGPARPPGSRRRPRRRARYPNDTMRVIRALELHRQGKPIGSYGQRVLEPAPAPVVRG